MRRKIARIVLFVLTAHVALLIWVNLPTAAAVKRTSNPKRLYSIANRADSSLVRSAAVEKLADQELLMKLATKPSAVQSQAIRKVKNQQFLWRLATREKAASVRLAAVAAITNQTMLAKILLTEVDKQILLGAVSGLTDPEAIADVVVSLNTWSGDFELHEMLVAKLSDQKALEKVAANARDWQVRNTALEKITDPQALERLSDDPDTGASAVRKLTDQAALARIASRTDLNSVGEAAVEGITDLLLIKEVVMTVSNATVRAQAIRKLEDQEILLSIALDPPDQDSGKAAADRVADPLHVGKLAIASTDEQVRKSALQRLGNKEGDELTKLLTEAAPTDWKVTPVISALVSLPVHVRVRMGAAVFPACRAANLPAVATEVGTVTCMKVDYEELSQSYKAVYDHPDAMKTYTATGERIQLSIFFEKLRSPVQITRATQFPQYADGGAAGDYLTTSFNVHIFAADVLDAMFMHLSQEALAQIACGEGNPDLRQAAVRRLLDKATLQSLATTDENASIRWEASDRLKHLQ